MRADYRHTWKTADALEAITGPYPKGGATSRDTDTWFSTCTLEQCIDMMQRGYVDIVPTIDIEPNVSIEPIESPDMLWSESGSVIDVPLFLTGEPECMGEMVNQPTPKPLVRIGVDSATSAGTDTETMVTVGRSVLTVVESLRARGYPTEVWSCVSVKSRGRETWDGRCLIQSSEYPVSVGVLAFWVAHPAALRRAWFALMETCEWDERKTFGFNGSYYGMPNHNFAQPDFEEWAPSPQHGTARAAQWITEVLARRT